MHRTRTAVLMVSAALMVAVAVIAFMAASGTDDSNPALASNPTPAFDPKPGSDGVLSGILEIQVNLGLPPAAPRSEDGGAPGTCTDGSDNGPDGWTDAADPDCFDTDVSLYHCIARQDHDASTNEVKVSTMCYAEIDLGPTNSAVPDLPGEGPDLQCTGTGASGVHCSPPPPPYTGGSGPNKGYGSFVGDVLTLTTCFPTDGNSGNIIAVTTWTDPDGQEAANGGKALGSMYLYNGQSDEQCGREDGDMPKPDSHGGDPPGALPILTQRLAPDVDSDGDTCTDAQELDKTGIHKCGDDPYNPLDSGPAQDDLSGTYSLTAIPDTIAPPISDPDCVKGAPGTPCVPVPGSVYSCTADIQHDTGNNDLDAKVMCYIDIAGVPVNPEAGLDSGDGFSGNLPAAAIAANGAPESGIQCQNGLDDDTDGKVDDGCPALFADVGSEHTLLTGEFNKTDNTMDIEGCFKDLDGTGALGNVYIRTIDFNAHTLWGGVEIWLGVNEGQPNCGAGPFTPGTGIMAELTGVRQSDKVGVGRDNDGDNCPTKNELSDNQQQGGLRDPLNRWDYMNPTMDGQNRVDDILATVNQYFIDAGNPDYTTHTDRTAVIGANPWNLGPPNGQQRVDDILASVKSYFHDCDGGTYVDPDDEL